MNSFIKYRNKRLRPKPNRKAVRRPYTGTKRFDSTCRSHGSCPYCAENRKYAMARQEPIPDWDPVGSEEGVLDEGHTMPVITQHFGDRTMKRFGIMVSSTDSRFDGAWLSGYEPTTRDEHNALYWITREAAARYMHNRFAGDPDLHVKFRIEEMYG